MILRNLTFLNLSVHLSIGLGWKFKSLFTDKFISVEQFVVRIAAHTQKKMPNLKPNLRSWLPSASGADANAQR